MQAVRLLDAKESSILVRVAREDDAPNVIKKRLSVYRDQTRPLVDFYRARSCLCEVDGQRSPDEVFGSLMGCLGEVA